MKEIYIKYDPYEMITELKINGESVAGKKYSNPWVDKVLRKDSMIPLQSWIEPIASEKWEGLLKFFRDQHDDAFEISFYGRKTDFEDLRNSLSVQNASLGNVVTLTYPNEKQFFMMSDSEMKDAVDDVVDKMSCAKFSSMVSKSSNEELKKSMPLCRTILLK